MTGFPFSFRRALPLLAGLLTCVSAGAAPVITGIFSTGRAPPRAQVGAPLFIEAAGLTGAIQVYFSDLTGTPTIPASPVNVDLARSVINVRVPAGAQTGNMKITAAGVDSPLYYFRVDVGAFTQGTDVVSGQVTNGATPLAGATVFLAKDTGCDEFIAWDYALSDATGNYSLRGVDGNYSLIVFPPVSAGLAGDTALAALGPAPVTQNFALIAGTTVTGRVVDAAAPSTGIPNIRVDFQNGPSFDSLLTDSTGNFSSHLQPGAYQLNIRPATGTAFAGLQTNITVTPATPQPLGNIGLITGVKISGTVTRASDGKPLPGVKVDATVVNTCCTRTDRKETAGDGSYSLYLPASQNYHLQVMLDTASNYVDTLIDPYPVGSANQTLNFPTADAAIITGTATDRVTTAPLALIDIGASILGPGGSAVAFTNTCTNGSYRLRVPPSNAGYRAVTATGGNYSYAVQAWNGNANGVFYPCEGTAVPAPTAGNTTAGINFALVPSGSISGSIATATSGCTVTLPGNNFVIVDDGASHQCGMGSTDFSPPLGQYRVVGLPSTAVGSTRRACLNQYGQCYNMKSSPFYDPFAVTAAADTPNINFCVSDAPTRQISNVRIAKSGSNLNITWNTSTDPNHGTYRIRGALTATPTTPPGNFPNDPVFASLATQTPVGYLLPLTTPYKFFQITDVSPANNEGPSGSYGH